MNQKNSALALFLFQLAFAMSAVPASLRADTPDAYPPREIRSELQPLPTGTPVLVHIEGSDRLKLQGWVTGKVSITNRASSESTTEERGALVELSVAKIADLDQFTCTEVVAAEPMAAKELNQVFIQSLRSKLEKNFAVTGNLAKELLARAFMNQVTDGNTWESTAWVHPELDSVEVSRVRWFYVDSRGRELAVVGSPVESESLVNLTLVQAGRCDVATAEFDLAQSNEVYRQSMVSAQKLAEANLSLNPISLALVK